MTTKELYIQFISELKPIYQEGEAIAITKIIFEHYAKLNTTKIINQGNEVMNEQTKLSLLEALSKLKKHVPVQYVTGNTWFYNLNFEVNNAVLIPRSETEELVLEAVTFLKNRDGKKVLDIGTGSGCIPIAINRNIPEADITSVDVSRAALEVAKKNATANLVEINFKELDFLDEKIYTELSSYDLIISNPPYIPESEKNILDKNVTAYEPHIALFVPNNDHLIFYRQIATFAKKHLIKNGRILVEIHEYHAAQTAALFEAENYSVQIKKDMQEKDRILIINQYP